MRRRCSQLLLAAVCVLMGAASAWAQNTGEIFGKVTDGSGGVLPGATITITSPVLLQPSTATATETGTYRFPQLAVGVYAVKFEMPGFKTVIRQGVRIEIGFNAQINGELAVSSVEETITVSGESPIIDTRKMGTSTTVTQEMLQSLPSSRDPWTVLEQTPAVAMDRANVGGTQSGQQSGFISRGATDASNMWNLDGVSVTDMSAIGASSVYYDFDAFEEMQFSTGGNDASQQTGGVSVNLVTKSGTDKFRGSGRYYINDEKFQGDNVDEELRLQGASAGNPIQRITDYGVEAGGPIVRGRAWFWGSYGMTDVNVGVLGFYKNQSGCPPPAGASTKDIRNCLQADTTQVENYNIKGSGAPFKNNKATWYSNYADKIRNARDASDLRPPETVTVQTGPVWTHKFSDQHVFSDRWLAEVQFAHVGGNFALDFPNPEEQFFIQRALELSNNSYSRSFSQSIFDRPITSVDAKTTYFLPGKLGGDHSFKAGVRWAKSPVSTSSHIGGFVTARFRNNQAVEADLHRDSNTAYDLRTWGAYLQDTYTRGRMSLNLGFRVDRQDDKALATTVGENPLVPQLLPSVASAGVDSGVVWTDVSPRLGFNYDLSGDGRTVARVSAARYYGFMSSGELASRLNPVGAVTLRYPWTDHNGDRLVTANELTLTATPVITGTYDPANPGSPTTTNTVDPGIKNDTTDEIVAGLEHELAGGIAVGASYIWRRYDNLNWSDRVGITSGDYVPVTRQGACADCPAYTFYQPTRRLPNQFNLTNIPDFYRSYNGIELTARKRLSNRWMVNGSFAYNDARRHYDSPNAYDDPTNIAFFDNAQYAEEAGGSGVANVWVNAKWLVKVSGLYQLPYAINVSAFYNARDGFLFPRAYRVTGRDNGADEVFVVTDPYGDQRLPTFQQLDMKFEKVIALRGLGRLIGSVDVFNLFNANTVLARRRQLDTPTFGQVSQILAPRVLRFGVKVQW